MNRLRYIIESCQSFQTVLFSGLRNISLQILRIGTFPMEGMIPTGPFFSEVRFRQVSFTSEVGFQQVPFTLKIDSDRSVFEYNKRLRSDPL